MVSARFTIQMRKYSPPWPVNSTGSFTALLASAFIGWLPCSALFIGDVASMTFYAGARCLVRFCASLAWQPESDVLIRAMM